MTTLPRNSSALEPDFKPLDWRCLRPEVLNQRIDEAGIVGMGGAGFPTTEKISIALRQEKRWLIANGIESDPGVTADQYLLEHHLEDVIEGIAITCRILDIHEATLAVNVLYMPASNTSVGELRIDIQPLEDPFRTGEERELITEILGVRMNAAQYPAESGILVLNIATLFAICEAVRDGMRPRDRVVTVLGKNRWVPIGMPIGQLADRNRLLRIGGPANGYKATPEMTVHATTNAVSQDLSETALSCIRCGQCTTVCPQNLPVEKMVLIVDGCLRDTDRPEIWESCNGCGACITTCPSEIAILDGIRVKQSELNVERIAFTKQTAVLARYERKRTREHSEAHALASNRASRILKSRTWT